MARKYSGVTSTRLWCPQCRHAVYDCWSYCPVCEHRDGVTIALQPIPKDVRLSEPGGTFDPSQFRGRIVSTEFVRK